MLPAHWKFHNPVIG